MDVILGIDIGGSTTKIVGLRTDGSVISMLRVRAEDQVTSLYGALGNYLTSNRLSLRDVRRVVLTGVGASYVEGDIYGLPTCKVGEFSASGTCKNVCASSAKGAASKSRTANCSAPGSAAFGGTSATAGCKASKRRLPSSTRHVRSPQTTSKAHTGGTGAARPPASNAHGVPATSMGHGCARVHSRLKTCASSGESAGARKGSISMYFSAPGNGGLLQKVSGCASSNG